MVLRSTYSDFGSHHSTSLLVDILRCADYEVLIVVDPLFFIWKTMD
jgi:hypothetical protein